MEETFSLFTLKEFVTIYIFECIVMTIILVCYKLWPKIMDNINDTDENKSDTFIEEVEHKNMNELKSNQILITISEDKKQITVECGAFNHPLTFDSCPDKTIYNIGNAITAYDEKTGLSKNIPEWKSAGCRYNGTGNCMDCN